MASAGFYDGLAAGCLVAAGVCAVGSLFVAVALPSRPAEEEQDEAQLVAPAPVAGEA